MGRWAAVAAAVLLLAGAVALALSERAGWPGTGRVLQNQLAKAGWEVELSDCRAKLITGPWLECGRVALGPERWFDATQLRVEWRWFDLWRWVRGDTLRLRNVQAQALQARLSRDAQGRGNWQRAKTEAATAQRAAPWPVVERLAVDQGRLRWEDVRERTALDVTVAGSQAGVRAAASGRFRDIEVALKAESSAPLPLLQAGSPGGLQPLTVQGTVGTARIGFDGRAAALMGARELDGALTLSGPSLARIGEPLGVTLPQTPPFELRGQLAHADGTWRLGAATARIGRSRLGGDFAYDTRAEPSRLTGKLSGESLLLADLGPSIGVAPGARQKGGDVLPDRSFDLPSLRAMDADVAVALDNLDLNTAAVRPLRNLRTRILLHDGSLQLQNLDAEVAGGRLRGDTRLDTIDAAAKTAPGTARWAAKLRFDGVDVATWFPGVRKGAAAPAYITGTLDATVDVRGAGRSTAQILSTLDGMVDVRVRDGTLSHLATEAMGLDLAQALGVLVRGDDALPLRCALIRLRVKDGVAVAGPALLDNRDSTVRIAGSINLADETLALVLRARPKDVSPLSLRAPVTVTGPWNEPKVGIEGRALGGRVLGAAVLGVTLGPLAALLPLIDRGEKEAQDPCAATPPR